MTASLVAAAVCAGGAALLVAGPRPVRLPRRPGASPTRGRRAVVSAAAAALVGAAVLLLDGTALALGLVALGAAGGVLRLWRRGRARSLAERRRQAVVDLGEGLVGELQAGLPPVTALQRGAEQWPEFGPVAAAARLGADVPEALRRLAAQAG
ncbi:MAG: type II secretion system F family protein, partial [Nocardioides sp.]